MERARVSGRARLKWRGRAGPASAKQALQRLPEAGQAGANSARLRPPPVTDPLPPSCRAPACLLVALAVLLAVLLAALELVIRELVKLIALLRGRWCSEERRRGQAGPINA